MNTTNSKQSISTYSPLPNISHEKAIGTHIILEFYECLPEKLDDAPFLEQTFRQTATVMGATILSSNFHPFSPIGASGVVIIKESHLTVHTWPEYAYAAIDIFTCGELEIEKGIEYLKNSLTPKKTMRKALVRGKIALLKP
ncbi:MAG: adenosylmethionine decarboxylase [Bacteroidota bacterium]